MDLTKIDLRGYGHFTPDAATFECTRFHLPASWDYVYANPQALLRIQHHGGGYLQMDPPGGLALFRVERGQTGPSFFTWLIPDGTPGAAFSNFWQPNPQGSAPGLEPDEYTCRFAPDAARYHLRHGPWVVDTEIWVPCEGQTLVTTVRVANTGAEARTLTVMPVLKPHVAPFSLAPWDVPHIYQTCAFCHVDGKAAFWIEARNPDGIAAKRVRAALVTDLGPEAFEVSADEFIGKGAWHVPQAAWSGTLARAIPDQGWKYGAATPENSVVGRPPVMALARKVTLAPGQSFEFTQVLGQLAPTTGGELPPVTEIRKLMRLLPAEARAKALTQLQKRYAHLFSLRSMTTPDAALNRYVNEFLPLQLYWVNLLDRGWPTGMRGTRDAAQDSTGIIPLDADLARRRLIELFATQRADGWFLRQYSTEGRLGTHDYRDYVDSGLWVWELLWEYICYTRDFAILKLKLGWLDGEKPAPVLEHAVRLLQYYLKPANRGEHGLCKIRAGDWNDSVNAAGLEGRGESGMVTCQAILALEQAVELCALLGAKYKDAGWKPALQRQFAAAAKTFRAQMLRHALNSAGFFNAVFNDAGKWIFSPKDPDGRSRINGPANSFAVIAGLVTGPERDKLLQLLDTLKGPHGWRLFYPALGHPPIAKLGRIGAGDLAPGLCENGCPYNHGSQGFLGRAAWTAGQGGKLHEILRYMFPYDQQAHPIDVAKTAPYGVVNHWKEAPGLEGAGGETFLSGSISTSIRNCYQGLLGFRPGLQELVIDPCLPAGWEKVSGQVPFLGSAYTLEISNPKGVECGVSALRLDGKPAGAPRFDPRLGREVWALPLSGLKAGARHRLEVTLG